MESSGTPETSGSTGIGASETGEPSDGSTSGSTSTGEMESSGSTSDASTSTTGSSGEDSSGGGESSGTTGEPACVPGLPCWCNDLVPPQPCPAAADPGSAACECYVTSSACECPSGSYDVSLCQLC
jgi:hypothetical protein